MQIAMNGIQRLVLGLLAVAVCKLAIADMVIEDAGLSIVYPRDRRKSIEVAMANFGLPKYGSFLRGELIYVSSQQGSYNNQTYLCYPRECQYGCDLNTSIPMISIPKQPGTSYIMLVDRGPRDLPAPRNSCYFLDKVYNAQMVGADAVLVANYEGENLTTLAAPDTDGTAAERRALTVSAGMISSKDADFLKDLLISYGSVTLLLNWTSSLPQSSQVTWEFWTGSEDVCGSVCTDRTQFTKAIKDQAIKLEQAALTKFTPRYFLYACKNGTNEDAECTENCFSNGRYCGWPTANNYTGKDVLRMNIRAKCFFQQASKSGAGYVWWEYATLFAGECSIAKLSYTAECASKVYDSLSRAYTLGSKSDWEQCANVTESDPQIPILEEELKAQYGTNDTRPPVAEVKVISSIRINGEQYRGSVEWGPVLRALCAAFPSGHEPWVCNSPLISDDECAEPNGEGYVKCGVGISNNRTRCTNTFRGYQCSCGNGFQLIFEPGDAFSETCDDINECLVSNAPSRNASCSCSRCACENTIGSYNCTGELKNMCTAEFNYGDCWNQTVGEQSYTSCVDNIQDYQSRASRGVLQKGEKWFKCGDCPRCFRPSSDGKGGCEPLCDRLELCDPYWGSCRTPQDDSGKTAGGGGGGGKSSSSGGGGGGVHPGFMVLVALGAAGLTGVVVMAANHIMMRRRMGEEIRDIMGAYMPLQEERARSAAAAAAQAQGGGGGGGGGYQGRVIRPDEDSDEDGNMGMYGWTTGAAAAPPPPAPPGGAADAGSSAPAPTLLGATQRSVWGPPAAAAPKAAAGVAAAVRPTVDAFSGGGGGGSGVDERLGLTPATAAVTAAAGDADPLLGRQMTSSSNNNLVAATAATATNPTATTAVDNPFM